MKCPTFMRRHLTTSVTLLFITLCSLLDREANCIAIAPSTIGTAVARAGKLSDKLKESTIWKTLMTHQNSLGQLWPPRAMRVVQEVVRTLRKDTRVDVELSVGRLRGRYHKFHTKPGGFSSFKGIRYGVAERFRAATPEQPWSGVREAVREKSSCPHKNLLLDTYKGAEDCLYLNVFTSALPTEYLQPRLPVMVWLHGGSFSFGSGNSFLYGPDFLVAEKIVLVTLNYRLGPLGFLTAGPEAPGNQGLKDQVLALKWVQEHIAHFGGDPHKVTVFGESAGGTSTQLLLLSPMGRNLFHHAISQSGSALNPWSMRESSTDRALRLATVLGYRGSNETADFLQFLREMPAKKLVEAAPKTLTAEDVRNNVGLPFVPVVEGYWNKGDAHMLADVYYEPPFLTEHPSKLYREQNFSKGIPYMIGYNSDEAMLFIRRVRKNPQILSIINNDFERLVPEDLNVQRNARHVSNDIRRFYLGSMNVSVATLDKMIEMFTDLMFLNGIRQSARYHAKYGAAPVYMYRFAFDGALGLYKRMLGINRPGVCHGDEMGYLFKFGLLNLTLEPQWMEAVVKSRMVRMWTNFAKYGNPTPDHQDDELLPAIWHPIDANDVMDGVNYMDITDVLEMKVNPESERQQFWDQLYERYNGNAF